MKLPGVASVLSYGVLKVNEDQVEDPSTEESADDRNEMANDVSAMTQTAWRAWFAYVGKASSPPDDPSSNVHGAVWGNGVSVKPTMARTGTGVVTATYPTTITDELGEVHTVNLRRCGKPNIEGATPYEATATVTAPNVVTVRTFTVGTSTPNDAVGATISVFVT